MNIPDIRSSIVKIFYNPRVSLTPQRERIFTAPLISSEQRVERKHSSETLTRVTARNKNTKPAKKKNKNRTNHSPRGRVKREKGRIKRAKGEEITTRNSVLILLLLHPDGISERTYTDDILRVIAFINATVAAATIPPRVMALANQIEREGRPANPLPGP